MALAPYAMEVARSAGRRHPEPPHPYRNDYQRDRNRLTHTLETSQIARTVAGALSLNEDLVEALALVHDIGHPPFGHAGEEKLDELMRGHGDRYDHNLHALRIVERFEQRDRKS